MPGYSKEQQLGLVKAGTKEAKDLLKRAFKREPRQKKKQDSLVVKAQRVFNAAIRRRDHGKPCINCCKHRTLQAGHLYPTSTHPHLRFDEINTNGECKQCNYFNPQSHQEGYRPNLIKKVGLKAVQELDQRAAIRHGHDKMDRLYLEAIIEIYKDKYK